jgi:tetratricopeptide (TPR) repeat protein
MLLFVSLAYANHFHNSFHFDDSHTIVDNAYIRDLRNIPLFFKDAATFSALPANRTYRPLVSVSLAIDYALGQGLNPVYFHASTFFWFLLQLVLIYFLFLKLCENHWIALFATALYGVHPAIAETVNYIIQRGDLYSTLGVIAALVCYIYAPGWRKFGLYLIPFIAALLSKPPALVFPAILYIYVWLYEESRPGRALSRCIPALAATGLVAYFMSAMTPPTYNPGSASAYAYRITQPLVAWRYFHSFFVPIHLTADTDFEPIESIFRDGGWIGFVFLAAVIAAAVWMSRKRHWRPAAVGLWWFILALVPTSIFPLAEVENDHRMFFPFVGLAIAVCWTLGRFLLSRPRPAWMPAAAAAAGVVVLGGYAWATTERNAVWRTEETLWHDVTLKSPKNGRGLMNYGLALMSRGAYIEARNAFNQAEEYTPNYSFLEINQGIVNGALNDDVAAEQHFTRALTLAPGEAEPHYFYARWLDGKFRWPEASEQLQLAIAANPDYIAARYLKMQSALNRGDWPAVIEEADATLKRFPSDVQAASYRAGAQSSHGVLTAGPVKAEDYLNLSLSYNRTKKFRESISAAEEALKLRPDYAEAYNNIAAAYEEMHEWDRAIEAAQKALKIKPDYQLAQNNLAWSLQQKENESHK